MYLPSKNQKSKVAIPARAIRTIRNIVYYNSPWLKKILSYCRGNSWRCLCQYSVKSTDCLFLLHRQSGNPVDLITIRRTAVILAR